MPNVSIDIKFEPRDMWVGMYWKHDARYFNRLEQEVGKYASTSVMRFVKHWWLDIYICIVPMLPIIISIDGHERLTP